ncbi:IS3 family transposase [Nakamurella leprariae]|uniref:IS3 family transposase n=1 Tax=Nakamurella leprariae TaxID=2803911 RepID=UPI002E292931|nr:IS3 family transposase [Nakamurella leprariae]
MPALRKYPQELRDRAQRLVVEAREQDPELSLNQAVIRIGERVGVDPDTLRGWCKQAAIDRGERPGTSTDDAKRIKDLEQEVRELKRANEILLAASSFFRAGARPATAVVVEFIDSVQARFGVEPICQVLTEHGVPIAPSGYYAFKGRAASARARRDEWLTAEIIRVFHDRNLGRGLAGARKIWRLLNRDLARQRQQRTVEAAVGGTVETDLGSVARCTVERLMRRAGLSGARRGIRPVRTTRPDASAPRPPDLIERNFTAQRPNALWVVDFTDVPTWTGMAFTAFVTDVYSRRIVGWRTATRMPTDLPLDALEMALWTRQRQGVTDDHGRLPGLIQHSDNGSQYTAIRYAERLAEAGALASIGTVGDSYDNAMAESVIGLYKTECVRHDGPFRTVDDLELGTLSWVHWFNTARLHSALDYATPIDHEQAYYRHNQPPRQPLPGVTALH